MLAGELEELSASLPLINLDLSTIGFESAEIDSLLGDLRDAGPDPADTIPALPKIAITRPGDLWALGEHRVRCGDARSRANLDHLMGGTRARMISTDPPFNVRVRDVQGRGRIKHEEFAFASGEMTREQYRLFLREGLGNAARVSVEGAIHYICIDWRHFVDLAAVGEEIYGTMLNLCVWAKTNVGQGSFYRSQHELIAVFAVGHAERQNNIQLGRFGRSRSNLWTYPGANSFGAGRMEMLAAHPTVKPLALVVDAMKDCTPKGDAVLDPYQDSGTTILAVEKVGRRGYGLEIDPRYVDTATKRWERFTKMEAILDGDGRTYSELKAERERGSLMSALLRKRPNCCVATK